MFDRKHDLATVPSARDAPASNAIIQTGDLLTDFYSWLPPFHPTRRLIERFLRGEPYAKSPSSPPSPPSSPPDPPAMPPGTRHKFDGMIQDMKRLIDEKKGKK